MSGRRTTCGGLRGHVALTLALAIIGAVGATGCDVTGFYYPWTLGLFDTGFLPDASTIQNVSDYRGSVFEAANDAWDAYIRE